MYSKQQLKNFLNEISENAEFPLFNYVSAEKYAILIKCRVDTNRNAQFYSEYAKEWIKKFTKFTKTGWIVRACFPNVKRFLYRKVFVCQHSSFNKRKTPERSGAKDKQCKAKIDFKIKFINRNTIRNDKLLKDGLNLTIHINFIHSHGLSSRESINLLKCSADTDELFYKYFSNGHTTATAKSYHELILLSNFGASRKHLSNAEINPTLHHATYLFNKTKKDGLSNNVADITLEKVKVFNECGGVLRYTNDYSIIVVATPFMKNVLSGHELDCIIVDSTLIKECVVSFFLVPTPLGALPIACALHSQATETSFSQAFFSTKLMLENQTLKSFEPNKIMINQLDEQNHALDAIFSNKKIYVSRASVIEGIWKTICEGEVKIDRKHRHKVMKLFTSLLHAENLQEAELFHKELEGNSDVQCAPKLKQYLTDIWNRREDYITPNKVVDLSLRILKQFILSRCYSYNSLIMVDVLLNILDSHWCQILHAHLRGKLVFETYTKFLRRDKTVTQSLASLEMTSQEYRLEKTKSHVTFRSDTMCCDCVKGRRGELCEHLCAVLQSVALTTSVPDDKRAFYMALAGEYDVKMEPGVQSDLEYDDQENEDNDLEETMHNIHTNEQYFEVKQEIQEHNDPLDDSNSENNSREIDIVDVKKSYVNALRALNDEFRRLNKAFRENPSASNLDTMGRLARELSKIKPVDKINLSNMYVELGVQECDRNMSCH